MKKILALCVSGLLVSSVFAQTQAPANHERREEVKKELLQKRINNETENHQARERILENASNCIKGAQNGHQYKECEKAEHEALKNNREVSKQRNEALHQEVQQMKQQAQEQRHEREQKRMQKHQHQNQS